jgi:hypothetical protein
MRACLVHHLLKNKGDDAVMFPFRYSTIFKSRWMALLWAAGFCWMAVDVASASGGDDNSAENGASVQEDATGAPYSDQDVKALEQSLKDF